MAAHEDVLTGERAVALAIVLALPLVALALLLAVPELDGRWEHQPAHFWLVLGVAVVNVVLGAATSEAAARRGDPRTFAVSLALLLSAGFLALHALATPGVLLDGPNTGFVLATPVGLLLASAVAAASARLDGASPSVGLTVQRRLRAAVFALLAVWAAASLAQVPLLDRPPPDEMPVGLRLLAGLAVLLYAYAAVRYLALYRERRRVLPLAVAVAWILLAQAMIAVVFARNWHATWWEWHVLMAAAFGVIFLAARREYRREGTVAGAFAGLYQARTLALVDRQSSDALDALTDAMRSGEPLEPVRAQLRVDGLTGERIAALEQSAASLRQVSDLLHGYVGSQLADQLAAEPSLADLGGRGVEVSVLFADLVGFTSFSESRPPEEGMELLNTYWAAVVPAIVDEYGGFVERFAGDGILVIFNTLGDQPDHALRACRCAWFIQQATGRIAAAHDDWPRFRIGINTGPAVVGNVGAAQRRNFTVIGDTANTAARFEALARPGRVLIGPATFERVRDDLSVTPLGSHHLKGKADPIDVYEVADIGP
ncbi:adenylate/guanylate cyclase domain-containing protein [Nitriliruptor alkaliphilus]|uniref:adenylate/guanylate cyclase domain-containing protein n=1 Tax=Nitriliruptor alkaliphilus TaxID=427918 RepID=UPI000697216D|nr:adenylate/guanylate cyclase domain-containing protein [Nitriliruptor alkaliphilus]